MDAAFLRLFFFTLGTCIQSHELFKTFNSFFLMLNKRPSVGTQLYPFMVSCNDKGRLILSGAMESGLV